MGVAAATLFLTANPAAAASPETDACRAVTNAAERLACFDRVTAPDAVMPADPATSGRTGRAPAAAALPARHPAAPAAPRAARGTQAAAARDGVLAAVTPLRHGYFRLQLDDRTSYDTTVVSLAPPVGAKVRVRRTLIGTTFFDIPGWSPIAVKRSRQQ